VRDISKCHLEMFVSILLLFYVGFGKRGVREPLHGPEQFPIAFLLLPPLKLNFGNKKELIAHILGRSSEKETGDSWVCIDNGRIKNMRILTERVPCHINQMLVETTVQI
jgi:hypothetical protein